MNSKKSFFAPVKAWKNFFKKPVTVLMKDVLVKPREAADRYRGFHTNDWDKCVGCGTCGEICPTKAITMIKCDELEQKDGHKPERPAFDYGRCSFCGLCVDICTSDSLGMSKEYIHISKNADTFCFLPKADGIHQMEFKNGYKRDEVSELLDLERKEIEQIPHEGRNESFMELIKGFSKAQAIAEASRCVECGVCTYTCPAHMNIPEYIKAVFNDNIEEGLDYLYKTNPLSNVCGRICTHKCESACVIGNRGDAIAIRWLKRYIADNAPDEMYENMVLANVSEQKKGKVGIIGAGPAGLSAGYYLRTLGYEVDIYEEKPLPGGVMRYGIPAYRLPEDKVAKDISFIEKIGVKIITNTKIGRDISLEDLKNKYDAVFAASGFWTPKKLRMRGVDHPDMRFSTDFLAEARDYTRGAAAMPDIDEKVIVIGGGDVSFDVARTLVRLQNEKFGKHNVQFVARKPERHLAATREEVVEGREEGITLMLDLLPVEVLSDADKKISGVRACQCITCVLDNGKAETKEDESTSVIIEGTQIYMAVGSGPDYQYITEELLEKIHRKQERMIIKENGQIEAMPWLFAGGDIVKGPDVISAVADGHNAAKGIDNYLSKIKE